MSNDFPAANFNWPIADRMYPVVLTLERIGPHQQLHIQATTYEDGYAEPWETISLLPHDGVNVHLCSEPDTFYMRGHDYWQDVMAQIIEQDYAVSTGISVHPVTSFVPFHKMKLTPKGRSLNTKLFQS